MNRTEIINKLRNTKTLFNGELYTDETTRILYSTDASIYREKPLAVLCPANKDDIKRIINFAKENKTHIIPRAAGTSLAGQVVGNGIVVDISKHLNKIIELNKEEKWVRIEPGVVLDELNKYLRHHGLFFAPETSTANRCNIGGMVGNNSCGLRSVIYGSTREHTREIKAVLSDGSEVVFGALDNKQFEEKCKKDNLEGKLYKNIRDILSLPDNQNEIRNEFPDSSNPRKNTGYALDILLDSEPFTPDGEKFNFCKLLTGSEGTLAFMTEIKLNLIDLPPKNKALVCAHFNSVDEALRANLIALKHNPGAVELIDEIVINCTKGNVSQNKNRFFINDEPKAILIIEFARETTDELRTIAQNMEKDMRQAGFGYHFPLVLGDDIKKVWELRKAGLGLLANVPGDRRSVTVIEDTSVKVELLPDYIKEFSAILENYGLSCVYYAHVGSGELHLRPLLNLKDEKDIKIFEALALEVAKLVKKYRGSLSGEHGDGRLRGRFIPLMIGEKNYGLLKEIKQTWDPDNIFNVGKITDAPSISSNLRYSTSQKNDDVDTIFDFSETKGWIRALEKCSGSGDCRKSKEIGGTMCPSFMALRNEYASTRGRANLLREFFTNTSSQKSFGQKEIYEILDLCLSCKACKSECPSSVDMAKLKAEFLQHYYDTHGIPLRSRLIANITSINRLGSVLPAVTNFFMSNKITSGTMKSMLGFAAKRNLPAINSQTLSRWYAKKFKPENAKPKVYLFNDEFTNYNDSDIGIKAILILTKLDYSVVIPKHKESARTFLSKGLVRKASKIATENVNLLSKLISEETPLVGIEPSAILSFRDEYPSLVGKQLKEKAQQLAKNTMLFDEFIVKEIEKGRIKSNQFTDEAKTIKLHGHCQQKAVASTLSTIKMLSLPINYTVDEIPSGCCGMAGSFGYEKEHYELSMKIGEMVLFPAVRKAQADEIIVAPGTSCRHQIKDGTGRTALHPVEVMYDALDGSKMPEA